MTATQVCLVCKGRKKRCDKKLPRCSYCEQNNKTCNYDYSTALQSPSPTQASERTPAVSTPSPSPVQIRSLHDPLSLDATIPSEVLHTIDATNQSIEHIAGRYFDGLHIWIPYFCPDRFGKDLVQFHASPTAEFSLLLLCMCLVTYYPPQHIAPPISREALYFQAKTLFTQLQVLRQPSVRAIQAGLFIATYEGGHGRPGIALATIDHCARMAYRIGMNKRPTRLGWNESWNTWWAIVILERIFYCESVFTEIPLVTTAPEEDDFLPHEVGNCEREPEMNPGFRVAPVHREGVGCLGRAAQAAYLLDRVLQTMRATNTTTSDRLASLIHLDGEHQKLLAVTMNKCHGERGGWCGAVGTSLRALSLLHQHILHLEAMSIESKWRNHSQAALDTVAQMIVDIARNHRTVSDADIDTISPVCNYMIRHTLQHIYERRYADSKAWFEDSDALRESLAKLNRRWSLESGTFSNAEMKTSVTSIDIQ